MQRFTLSYSGSTLDRATERRDSPQWLSQRLVRSDTRIVPLWRGRNLVSGLSEFSAAVTAVAYSTDQVSRLLQTASETIFLGLESDTAVFALDLCADDEDAVAELAPDGEFVDLRRVGPLLNARDAALLAQARGLAHWHRNHRYCGRCGHPSESRRGGYMRVCTNTACGREGFPRIDPAVIMLVESVAEVSGPRRCLLGHHSRFPGSVFSTLAGFVEPGECLEEAVAREVFEEVGVAVDTIIYQASQPWPFPSQIMLGFRARAVTKTITVDRDEITEARWFTPDEVRAAGEWGDGQPGVQLPRRDSIARFLIDSWAAEASRR